MAVEILQLIARHITASDWARGACLACRLLCDLELQDLTLYPVIDVPGMIYIEARFPESLLASLFMVCTSMVAVGCMAHSVTLYMQKCPGVSGKPCSEECGLTASKVVRALLWASKRASNSTAVFGGLLSACHKTRHNQAHSSAKAAVRTNSIGAHLGGLPQYGHIRILDARTAGPLGDQYSTDASAVHDRIWMLKGIEHVLEDHESARPWRAQEHCRLQTSRHLEPIHSHAVRPGGLVHGPRRAPVPASPGASQQSQA